MNAPSAGDAVDRRNDWLNHLLVTHESRLLRYARRWVSEESSREIVQECFLKLWNERSSLEGRETEWLFCVTRNLAIDRVRKEKKMRSLENEDELPATQANAHEVIEEREQDSAVAQQMKQLTEAQQEVVRLKFQEGFSYKEISAITGYSVSHVGVLIHEAMKRLKAALNDRALAHGGEA